MFAIRRMPAFDVWLAGIKDVNAQRRLLVRLRKASLGNLGDVEPAILILTFRPTGLDKCGRMRYNSIGYG